MTKKTLAKVAGWGQVVVTYVNEVLKSNGGLVPTTKSGWLTLGISLLSGLAIHHASNTSATTPNGGSQ